MSADAATHLARIAHDLRSSGQDMALVYMDEEGAGRIEATLADELFAIAFSLDYNATMAEIRRVASPDLGTGDGEAG